MRGYYTIVLSLTLPDVMAYTLTSKSQVTLPKAIRDHLRVAPGDAVDFRIAADGTVRVDPLRSPGRADLRRAASAAAHFDKLRGIGGASGQEGTDALMSLLRGSDEDAADPGFADPGCVAPAIAARRR